MTGQVTRIARLQVDPARLEQYLALLTEEIDTSIRTEPGVLMLHATARQDAPNQIELLEVYASQAAYEAHVASPHFLKYKQGTADMVRHLELIDVTPIRLAAKPADKGV